MKNLYFNDRVLPVLLQDRPWRLVSVRHTDARPVSAPRHRRWMPTHQHAHPHAEAMIALQGRTVYGINHRIYPCVPGTVFVFDPNFPHDNGYPSWTPAITHLWISFLQDKAMARLMTCRHGRIHVKDKIHCLLDLKDTTLWQEDASATCSPELPSKLIRLRLLAALADLAATLVEEGFRDIVSDQRHRFQREKIYAICRHIRKTGGADASLDHLAQIAGYSKFHFLRLFRQYTGQSIHTYVNQARLHKVKALLSHGLALKAIAMELGFSCPAAFSRWYRPFRK